MGMDRWGSSGKPGGGSQGSNRPQRDNSGAIWDNSKNKKTPSHPDLRGQGIVNGQKVWIAGWFKKSKAGNEFLSLAFTPVQDRQDGDDDDEPPRSLPR